MKIDGHTKVFGILGNPVAHSLSPLMHNSAFAECGLNCAYLPFRTEDVAGAVRGIRSLDIRGASVTVPHKEAVMAELDAIDPVAAKIGSVNTIVVQEQGGKSTLVGHNTDWIGSNRALESVMGLQGASVVVVGAGGAARAVGFGLIEAGATITLCSRTEARGRKLADELGCPWTALAEVDTLQGDALVNATSVGMEPNSAECPVPAGTSANYQVVMDIVYAPLQTMLLTDAERCGCKTVSGLDMLLYQGVAQFELWLERPAPVEVMRKMLYQATGNVSGVSPVR